MRGLSYLPADACPSWQIVQVFVFTCLKARVFGETPETMVLRVVAILHRNLLTHILLLQKGAVLRSLLKNLPVGVIEISVEHLRQKII